MRQVQILIPVLLGGFVGSFLFVGERALEAATVQESAAFQKIRKAFENIKGCYWMTEDLTDSEFRTYSTTVKPCGAGDRLCREQREKKPRIASSITRIYDSHIYFDPETKKPLKEVYVGLLPHNHSPGASFQLVIDEDSYAVKGEEIRGRLQREVIDRDTVGMTEADIKAKAAQPEEAVQLKQQFRASGSSKKGLTLLVSDGSATYNYVLKPAKRSDCVDESLLDEGLPKPER